MAEHSQTHSPETTEQMRRPLELSADQLELMHNLKADERTAENLDRLGLPVGEGVVPVLIDGEKRSVNISPQDYGTVVRQEAKETVATVERLGLDSDKLQLILQLVASNTETLMASPSISPDALDAVVHSNYRYTIDKIEASPSADTLPQVLAALVAAGSMEQPQDSYTLLQLVEEDLVKLVGAEQTDNLKTGFEEAINFKSYDGVSFEEKADYLRNKFMNGAMDIAERYPKYAAALYAFGAGSTIRDPQTSGMFVSALHDLSEYDKHK